MGCAEECCATLLGLDLKTSSFSAPPSVLTSMQTGISYANRESIPESGQNSKMGEIQVPEGPRGTKLPPPASGLLCKRKNKLLTLATVIWYLSVVAA